MHRIVGVIIKNWEELDERLAPYDEGNEEAFEECNRITKEDYIKLYKIHNKNTTLTDDEIFDKAIGEYSLVKENEAYDLYNPNAQFDWYQIGGRWNNILYPKAPNKKGYHGDASWCNTDTSNIKYKYTIMRIRDIDWTRTIGEFDGMIPASDVFICLDENNDNWITDIGQEDFFNIIEDPKYQDYWYCIIDAHI